MAGVQEKVQVNPNTLRPNEGSSPREEWFKPHPLVLVSILQIKGPFTPPEIPELVQLAGTVYGGLADGYQGSGCPVLVAGADHTLTSISGQEGDGHARPGESRSMIINPVLLGRLTDGVYGLFSQYSQKPSNAVDIGQVQAVLMNELPEVDIKRFEWPYVMGIGRKIAHRMGVKQLTPPNFVNMVFFEDLGNLFHTLPGKLKKLFGWLLMAKLGAFKNILVTYRKGADGQLEYDLYLNSLEGGHPKLTLEKLSTRLRAFGSATELGAYEMMDGASINPKAWADLPEVKALIDLGQFCGEYGLLSQPVEIDPFIKGNLLKEAAKRVAGYSRQAEGAFQGFVIMDKKGLVSNPSRLNLPWAGGLPVVSASGRFGVVKTDPKPDDFVPIGGFDGTKAQIIRTNAGPDKGPSIEAFELIGPQSELVSENPEEYLLRLRKVEGGYIEDPDGSIVVPGLARAIYHFHRRPIINNPEKVQIVDLDIADYPPAPCGSDILYRLSKEAQRVAHEKWIKGGKKAVATVVKVKNHGIHVIMHWTPDENGVIPPDSPRLFKKIILDGSLVLEDDVEQE